MGPRPKKLLALLLLLVLLSCAPRPSVNTSPIAEIPATDVPATPTVAATPTLLSTPLPTFTATITPLPTLTPDGSATPTATATNEPTITPNATATYQPTATTAATTAPPTATPLPEPTETPSSPRPTATAELSGSVSFDIVVVGEVTDRPIDGAQVRMVNQSSAFVHERTTRVDGNITFSGVSVEDEYVLTVSADGYLNITKTLTGNDFAQPLTVRMTDSISVSITRVSIHMRTGPGVDFASLGLAIPGDDFRVIGKSADNEWLLIESNYPVNTWIAWIPETLTFTGDVDALPIIAQ